MNKDFQLNASNNVIKIGKFIVNAVIDGKINNHVLIMLGRMF